MGKKIHISKLRWKNYSEVIEVRVPIRFYWANNDYDGFEFGPLTECTKYQLGLLGKIVNQLFWEHHAGQFVLYIKEHYPDYWRELVKAFESGDIGIPEAFLDAFRDGEKEVGYK